MAAHPRLAAAEVRAVRDAFVGMAGDPEGNAILKASAELVRQPPPYGFVPAHDEEYRNQREAYRAIWKHEGR